MTNVRKFRPENLIMYCNDYPGRKDKLMITIEQLIKFMEDERDVYIAMTLPWQLPDNLPDNEFFQAVKNVVMESNAVKKDFDDKIIYYEEVINILKTIKEIKDAPPYR